MTRAQVMLVLGIAALGCSKTGSKEAANGDGSSAGQGVAGNSDPGGRAGSGAGGARDPGTGGSMDAGAGDTHPDTGAGGGAVGPAGTGGAAGAAGMTASGGGGPDRSFSIPASVDCYPHAVPVEAAPVCSPALCGNAQIDSCQIPGQGCQLGTCPPITASEECDGADVQQQSCQAKGFARGALRCSASCRLDWSGCGACGADPHIEGCVRVDGANWEDTTQNLAVASNGSAAAIAWLERSNVTAVGRAHFAVINDDLTLTTSDCFGDEGNGWRPYLAAVPGGWMLASNLATAAGGAGLVRITLFDGSGKIVATPAPSIEGVPLGLVGRPDGGPLLLYGVASPTGSSVLMAALLDADGKALWSARIADRTQIADTDAVYTGDGFLWVSRNSLVTAQLLARIDLKGTVTTTTLELPQTFVFPGLVWNGTRARLFWNSSWIELDKNGGALGEVRALLPETASQPQAAASGGTTAVLLLTGPTNSTAAAPLPTHPKVVIIGPDGTPQPPVDVFQYGTQTTNFLHRLVSVKNRWLAAALSQDSRLGYRIFLAWIRP